MLTQKKKWTQIFFTSSNLSRASNVSNRFQSFVSLRRHFNLIFIFLFIWKFKSSTFSNLRWSRGEVTARWLAGQRVRARWQTQTHFSQRKKLILLLLCLTTHTHLRTSHWSSKTSFFSSAVVFGLSIYFYYYYCSNRLRFVWFLLFFIFIYFCIPFVASNLECDLRARFHALLFGLAVHIKATNKSAKFICFLGILRMIERYRKLRFVMLWICTLAKMLLAISEELPRLVWIAWQYQFI